MKYINNINNNNNPLSKLSIILSILLLLCSCSSNNSNNNTKQVISTPNAPSAVGPYNQAIIYDNIVYCSGQIAIDPITNELVEPNIETQTNQVFNNIKALLEASGSSLSKVLKVNVYLTNINDFSTVNKIYETYFKDTDYPARSCVEVSNLPKGALIEIEVTAYK